MNDDKTVANPTQTVADVATSPESGVYVQVLVGGGAADMHFPAATNWRFTGPDSGGLEIRDDHHVLASLASGLWLCVHHHNAAYLWSTQ